MRDAKEFAEVVAAVDPCPQPPSRAASKGGSSVPVASMASIFWVAAVRAAASLASDALGALGALVGVVPVSRVYASDSARTPRAKSTASARIQTGGGVQTTAASARSRLHQFGSSSFARMPTGCNKWKKNFFHTEPTNRPASSR